MLMSLDANDKRDTIEAPPLFTTADRATIEATPIALPEDKTSSAPAIAAGDKIARQRGLPPIRIPTKSTAFVALHGMASRRLVIVALAVALAGLAIGASAVIWARSAVAQAEAAR
jgi:hypothetical protein